MIVGGMGFIPERLLMMMMMMMMTIMSNNSNSNKKCIPVVAYTLTYHHWLSPAQYYGTTVPTFLSEVRLQLLHTVVHDVVVIHIVVVRQEL